MNNIKGYTYSEMMDELCGYVHSFEGISVNYLTESILGRAVPRVIIGNEEAECGVLYVGAHHGAESITAKILMRFIKDYLICRIERTPQYGKVPEKLYDERFIEIIPMLNPDGVEIAANGADVTFLMKDRLVKMNGGKEDFSHWQANARGVDLNHNYGSGFEEYKRIERERNISGGAPGGFSGEYPESEPESGALANYLRFGKNIKSVVSFHTQGEVIYCPGEYEKRKPLIDKLEDMTGYTYELPEGSAAYGGLADFCEEKLGLPAFTLECGKGKNPLPLSDTEKIYAGLREMLFVFPTLFE